MSLFEKSIKEGQGPIRTVEASGKKKICNKIVTDSIQPLPIDKLQIELYRFCQQWLLRDVLCDVCSSKYRALSEVNEHERQRDTRNFKESVQYD
jgi:hypothetical protein